MNKKKILITTDTYFPECNSITRFLGQLIPEIKEKFEITILAPEIKGKQTKIPGTKIKILPTIPIKIFNSYITLKTKQIEQYVEETDLVFNQTTGPIGKKAIKTAQKINKPIISYVHNIEWEKAYYSEKKLKWLAQTIIKKHVQNLYNKCSILLVPSKETENILEAHNIPAKKLLIEHGINTEKFIPPLSKKAAKKHIKIPENYKIIGFAGNLGREKDLKTLTKAFINITKKHKNTLLLLVGKEKQKELDKHIKIIKTGQKQNILPYLQAMDIFVNPSLTQISSIATQEAMSTGLATITTPTGILKEYIQDQENGMIFPRGNANILADNLKTLLEKPELIKKLGKKARETIKEKTQWSETANKIKRVLEKV
ncbi:glycosyltransferase family 4 protein [Candidatus Woesearchaeota archaeon]|nr:glycosyltransferase family 4 protein [Candidatus Woesearchaeota archaeon]MBW2978672.1 glycosyltransferase family 4 protein [Candidatus Woesearchaeota archaeon]